MHPDSFTLAIASGKGGTGKTLVATNVAAIEAASGPVVLADCDVEAPNAHLFLAGHATDVSEVSVPLAVVDPRRVHCMRYLLAYVRVRCDTGTWGTRGRIR